MYAIIVRKTHFDPCMQGAVKNSFFTAPAKSRTGNWDFAAIFFVFALLLNEIDAIYGGKTAAMPRRPKKVDGC